jgi:probable rRNA maturation factor
MTRPTEQQTLPVPQPPADDASAREEPPRSLHTEIIIEGGDWSSFEPLENLVLAATEAVARSSKTGIAGEMAVTIALSTDRHVQDLNRDFRDKDSPTNVLSFPSDGASEPDGQRYLGDVILACETVGRESIDLQISPSHHLQHLVVHGLLHLLGFDHDSDIDAETMETLEIEILADLGIDDPYTGTELLSATDHASLSATSLDRK